jgi:hypothetical protein
MEITIPSAEVPAIDPNTPAPEATQPQTGGEDRPEWLPSKFKSAADMAKAYGELETKLGASTKLEVPAAPKEPEGQALIEKAEQLFMEKGSLDDATYKSLEKSGLPRRVVDKYIEGRVAQVESDKIAIMGEVGGPENFQGMAEWARDSLPKDEITEINAMLAKGGTQARLGVRALKAAYESGGGATGGEPNLVGDIKMSNAAAYATFDDMLQDMKKPEYHDSESFRNAVAAKLQRSRL